VRALAPMPPRSTTARAPNRAKKNETLAARDEPACTEPGATSNIPVCAGPGGRACCRVSSKRRSSRAFSEFEQGDLSAHRSQLGFEGHTRRASAARPVFRRHSYMLAEVLRRRSCLLGANGLRAVPLGVRAQRHRSRQPDKIASHAPSLVHSGLG
jgi:hypothetical protein